MEVKPGLVGLGVVVVVGAGVVVLVVVGVVVVVVVTVVAIVVLRGVVFGVVNVSLICKNKRNQYRIMFTPARIFQQLLHR